MIAAIASAAIAAEAGAASAQGTPPSFASTAPAMPQGTVFTGDVIQGKRVISALDVRDLEPGRKHLFYFQGVQTVTGQHWYVSVMVAKGARPGKRILLTSGVHGDEISPMHTLQTVMNQLDPARMSGTVTGGLRRVPPRHRRHGAPLAEFGAGHRSHRHEPRMARPRERLRRARPARRAAVRRAVQAERRLRDRLPHRRRPAWT